jgi:hypothetical protein
MLKKIQWKDDAIFSIKVKDELFSIAQMRANHIMQFFAISNRDGHWHNLNLNNEQPLFFAFVAEGKIKSLFHEKIEDESVIPSRAPIPTLMLSASIGTAGSIGANLIELDENYSTEGKRIVKADLLADSDLALIYQYELAGMIGAPQKIKNRLVRFFDTGVNWDDAKSFIFKNIPLPKAG